MICQTCHYFGEGLCIICKVCYHQIQAFVPIWQSNFISPLSVSQEFSLLVISHGLSFEAASFKQMPSICRHLYVLQRYVIYQIMMRPL
jgi:hypothetical protein